MDDNDGIDNLTNLNGLNCLTYIAGNLIIDSNDMLNDIAGLENVLSIGISVSILNNQMLSNLTGLNNVISIGGDLDILFNDMLTDCCVFCALLTEDASDPTVIAGGVTIQNNNTGCQSQADIESCSPCARPVDQETTAIPTMGEWGLMSLGIIFLILGVVSLSPVGRNVQC